MTPAEIEAVLQLAFNKCNTADCPLTAQQKAILLEVLKQTLPHQLEVWESASASDLVNPLDELSGSERQKFFEFVKQHEQENCDWKIQLMNDWLQERNSGRVQFIRDRYGIQWLNRLKPIHFAKYATEAEETLKLKVGSHIEVSNGLWEWVQETGPCSREWFTCTVLQIKETWDGDAATTSCIIRFDNGAEYEIQGVYTWNRYNWRWSQQ